MTAQIMSYIFTLESTHPDADDILLAVKTLFGKPRLESTIMDVRKYRISCRNGNDEEIEYFLEDAGDAVLDWWPE